MGKGRIVSAHGEGRYTLEIAEDRTRAESSKAMAESRVADLESRITDLESDLADAQDAVTAAADAQDQTIADYRAALSDDQVSEGDARQKMLNAGEAIAQAAAKRDSIRNHIRAAKAKKLSLQARINRINALPPLRQIEAWCADYTEDLSGEVATAEVPGEIGQVIVKPGFEGANQWSPGEDGAIQPALSGTPASVFYNLAMLPGWQKWRPTFRIATISNIDNDLCDITLDAAASSQQNLGVNSRSGYSGVPIMYMDCNGGAFEDGDRVLVAFSGNTNKPMVVGFEREPKECGYGFSTFYRKFQQVDLWDDMHIPNWQTSPFDCAEVFTVSAKTKVNNIFARGRFRTTVNSDFPHYVWVALYRCEGVTPVELYFYGLNDDASPVSTQIIEAPENSNFTLEPGVNYMIWLCPTDTGDRVYDRYNFRFDVMEERHPQIEFVSPDAEFHEKYSYLDFLDYPYASTDPSQNIGNQDESEQFIYDIIGVTPGTVRRVAFGSAEGAWVNLIGVNFKLMRGY